jgi:predicted RNA binding protein YcfA (HicA-like mRNA interferase family)
VPKLPRIKPSEVIRVLQRLGFLQVRQRGSHLILKKQFVQESEEQKIIEVGCVVPLHNTTVAVGTLKSILNQAGVSVEEFLENL